MTSWARWLPLFLIHFLICAADNKESEVRDPSLVHNDGVVAIVDDWVLTVFDVTSESQLREQREHWKYSREEIEEEEVREELLKRSLEIRERIAIQMIEDELVFAEFQRSQFSIPQAVVDDRVNRTIDRAADGDVEKFKKQLATVEITLEEFRERTRKQIAVNALLDANVYGRIRVSPKEIAEYYKRHPDEFSVPAMVTLQSLSVDSGEEETVKKLQNAIDAGDGFKAIAAEHKAQMIALPEQNPEGLKPLFREAITKLKEGEVSKPIALDGTLLWIKVVKQTEAQKKSMEEARERIKAILSKQEREERYSRFMRKLRSRSYIKKYFY